MDTGKKCTAKLERTNMNLARFSNVFFLRPNTTVAFFFALLMTAGTMLGQASDPPKAPAAQQENACVMCHDDQQKKLAASAHKDLTCDTCHSLERHGETTIERDGCMSCHHAADQQRACDVCHAQQASLFKKGPAVNRLRQGTWYLNGA